MYTPRSFREDDPAVARDLIDAYGFATLISATAGDTLITHLPLILDRAPTGDRLLGHVARANDHWKLFDGQQSAVAIFHGPHAYVSPAWYTTHPSVPTWNYAVVHAQGAPLLMESAETAASLERLIEQYEANRRHRWTPDLTPAFVDDMLRAIVGFEMPIARLEAKFKLSQNRNEVDREGALAGLEGEDDPRSPELAAFARRHFARRGGET